MKINEEFVKNIILDIPQIISSQDYTTLKSALNRNPSPLPQKII